MVRFGQTIPHLLDTGSLLDVGCGEGYFLKELSDSGLVLAGCDISPVRLGAARRNLTGTGISLFTDDIRCLHHGDGEYDQVTALEVLEHIPEWQQALSELMRVASRRVVVTVPYDERLVLQSCPECGETAYLYGHMNSFREDDFPGQEIDGDVSFRKLRDPMNPMYYVKRMAAMASHLLKGKNEGNGTSYVLCPGCYNELPYTRMHERIWNRVVKLARRRPEYLLVEIDKHA
jgi:SAM-dependent methyltransferase